MKVSIACPSYRRPECKTLDVYPKTTVYVDACDIKQYKAVHKDAKFVVVPDGVQGNVCRVRNYILDTEFENGADAVVILDDDYTALCRHEHSGTFGYNHRQLNQDELIDFCAKGSMLCEEWGYKLWGVNYSYDQRLYKQFEPFSTTKCVLGPFQAHLKNNIRYDCRLPLKEDYDISLQHLLKYGGVLRFNAYHYHCEQSKQCGGCATYRNIDNERKQLELLMKKWDSDIVKVDKSSKKKFDYNPIIKSPIAGV